MSITRHALLCLLAALALQGGIGRAEGEPLTVSMMIPGQIDDGGFMEAGFDALVAIETDLGAQTRFIANVEPAFAPQIGALQSLAEGGPDLIIAHGAQSAAAAEVVAAEFPNVRFVVVQGDVTGANLASYEVRQEESAWLAGAAAGLLTETDVVGHIAGIRAIPTLRKARGAFHDGLMHTNPDARFLTTFTGDQDDEALAYAAGTAQVEAGADIVFTMLNAGRTGVTEAMREKDARQLGSVSDWVSVDPEVFVGSADADVGAAALAAARDLSEGTWTADTLVQVGVEDEAVVGLTLGPDVPEKVRGELDRLERAIAAGAIDVSVDYDGEEFEPR